MEKYEKAKQFNSKMNTCKVKEIEYQVPRDFLLMVKFEASRVQTYCYNVNGEIVQAIKKIVSKLSRWSIARKKISQKIKYEMLGAYNIVIDESIEYEFEKVFKKYDSTFIDKINELFVVYNKVVAKENDRHYKYKQTTQIVEEAPPKFTITQLITILVNNPLPVANPTPIFKRFPRDFQNFRRVQLLQIKPKIIAQAGSS